MRLQAVEAREEFLDEARVHGKVVEEAKSMFTGRVETSDQVLLVLCTFPDEERARQIGTVLVERQLAACVNLVPRMTAIYRWEGQTCEESEVLALLKTTTGCFDELRE